MGGADRVVHVWELATGTERRSFTGHTGSVRAWEFSPDGKTVASGSTDTTVLVWNLYGDAGDDKVRPARTASELDAIWSDLSSKDGLRAHQALCRLLREPAS